MTSKPAEGTDIVLEFPPELITYKDGTRQLRISLRTTHVDRGEDTISVNNALAVRMGHAGFRQERSGAGADTRGSTEFVTENRGAITHFLDLFREERIEVKEQRRDAKLHLELPHSIADFIHDLGRDAGTYLSRSMRAHRARSNAYNGHHGRGSGKGR
jgi:hypothetical protein